MRAFLATVLVVMAMPAAALTVDINEMDAIPVGTHLEYAIVADGTPYADIPAEAWQRSDHPSLNIGFVASDVWVRLRFRFSQPDNEFFSHWYLNLNTAMIWEIRYSHWIDGSPRTQLTTGSDYRFASRQVAHREFNFRVQATAGEHEIRMLLRNRGNTTLSPTLERGLVWFTRTNAKQAFAGALFGVLLILAMFNAFIFFVSRERPFLYLAIALVAAMAWRATMAGFASQYLYPNMPILNDVSMRFAPILYLSGVLLFTCSLLRVPEWSPRIARLFKYYPWVLVAVVTLPIFEWSPAIGLFLVGFAPLLCIGTTIWAFIQRLPGAGAYGLGMLIFGVGVLTSIGQIQGWLPHNAFTLHAGDFAVTALGVLSSLALANRIVEEKLAKEIAMAESRSKSEFLANVSHELRTPLNAIVGFSDLMMDEHRHAPQQESLSKIQSASKLLLGVINDVLDYSKFEAGKLELERIPVHSITLLGDLEDLFKPQAESKGLEYETFAKDDFWFEGDPTRLAQILGNLISNAIKFTESGRIEVHLARPKERAQVSFEIHDNGIGMTTTEQARLFQPFTQADASTTRRFGGTGLGLAITKQLADAMDGELALVSEPGRGSCFTLTLPFVGAEAVNRSEAPHSITDLSSLRVLVVEDNATNQLLAARMLKKLGANCDIAENGKVAVEAVQQRTYDVIFMDCQMPIMDGYTATRELRSLGSETPIIAMTANALDGDRDRCIEAGMDDYMAKPIRLDEVRSALIRWSSASRTEGRVQSESRHAS